MIRIAVASLCLATATFPALADELAMPMHHGAHAATPAEKANAAAMSTMMRDMDAKPTGNPDKDFARMMTAHHQGAVAMARIELQYGKDDELQTLARTIIDAQEKEIAQMTAWMAAHP